MPEQPCDPPICTPGDTRDRTGPINTADSGPTDDPGPTTDPGPEDDPITTIWRPDLSRFCTTRHNISRQYSNDGGATWLNGGQASGTKPCPVGDDTNDDPDPVTCPPLPDANMICDGQTGSVICSDATTRTVAGTKTGGGCCVDIFWDPESYTCKEPGMLIQVSNCKREREVACTDPCYPNAVGYRPLRSKYYTDETFTQSNGCDTREATGTKPRPFSCDLPDATTICYGEPGTATCSDGTTRTVYGTKTHCSCTNTCPPPCNAPPEPDPSTICKERTERGYCTDGSHRLEWTVVGTKTTPPCAIPPDCDRTYLAPDGRTPEAYAQTCRAGTSFTVTNKCRRNRPWPCEGRSGRWVQVRSGWALQNGEAPNWASTPAFALGPGLPHRATSGECSIPSSRTYITISEVIVASPYQGVQQSTGGTRVTYVNQECR